MKEKYLSELHKSTFYKATKILSKRDMQKLYALSLIQVFLSILDLAGVAVIGILGALAIKGIQSAQPGNRVTTVLNFLNLEGQSFQTQTAILGVLAAFLLALRTVLSVYFTRRTLFFLSRKAASSSVTLVSKVLSQPLLEIQTKSSQNTLFSVTNGVSIIMLGVLGSAVTIVADSALMIVLGIGLFLVDKVVASICIFVFGSAGFLLFKFLVNRTKRLGFLNTELTIKSNEKILEILGSYRELVVRNRRDFYANEIGALRIRLGEVLAENNFLPFISKYVIESILIFGALIISFVQFIINDAANAVATLTVFMAAGSRIAPAAMRIQQSTIMIKGGLSAALPTIELISKLANVKPLESAEESPSIEHTGFIPGLDFNEVSFTYPESNNFALNECSFQIIPGSSVAIVGVTGSGKTTLVDTMLGILKPQKGKVLVSGLDPEIVVSRWPGAISYVPQDVVISNGTILENICLGFNIEHAKDELVIEALKGAQLWEYVQTLPLGINTQVGERGTKLSGGQRQRLGIARALFTNPKLLVLDEATSALDGETELSITQAIRNLKGKVTVISIAHRLSTVRNSDVVFYMENGRILCSGNFDEVRDSVPDFDRQAKLMGL